MRIQEWWFEFNKPFRRTTCDGRSSHVFRARSIVHCQTRLRRLRSQNSRCSPSRWFCRWSAYFPRFLEINFNHYLLLKLLINGFLICNCNCSSLFCCLESLATLSSWQTSTTSSKRKDAGRVSLRLSTHPCPIFAEDSSSVRLWSCMTEPKVWFDKFCCSKCSHTSVWSWGCLEVYFDYFSDREWMSEGWMNWTILCWAVGCI